MRSVPFKGRSEYRDKYFTHPLDSSDDKFVTRATAENCVWRNSQLYDNKFSTTYRECHDEKPLEPFDPAQGHHFFNDKFFTGTGKVHPMGTTTHRHTFVQHPLDPSATCPSIHHKRTELWKPGDVNYMTENQDTIGRSGKVIRCCPAGTLTRMYPVKKLPDYPREHIYFDDHTKEWY